MTDSAANVVWANALLEELARAGVTDLCLAPGSRSTPLVLAAVRGGLLRTRVHLDERSAAFFALGMGKASGRPAAVLTTSGTAAANLFPAAVEAAQAEVPLLLLTADRPHRLRDSDANQTIDQNRLFGPYVRAFFEVAPPVLRGPELRHLRSVAARAVATSIGLPAGPVHLNLPFDKPLVPLSGGTETRAFAEEHPRAFSGRPDGRPFVTVGSRRPELSEDELSGLADLVDGASRGVIVAGPASDSIGEAVLELAGATGFPLLADPLSGTRFGHHGEALVIGSYDLFLRDARLASLLRPDLVVRVGQSPTSAAALRWIEEHTAARQVVLDPGGRWKDHLAVASDYLQADPTTTLPRLARRVKRASPDAWTLLWSRLEERTGEVVARELSSCFFEGTVVAEVLAAVPEGGRLFVSNSMPVRDLDAFGAPRATRTRVLANRGASGIDGIVSTALGASAVAGPVLAVLGDLAFFHDSNGLLATRESDVRVVFVVIHNDGGGIFHFLPVRDVGSEFIPYFATPHGLDFSHLARLHGLPFTRASDVASLRESLREALARRESSVVEVRSEREENRRWHEAVVTAVQVALEDLTGEAGGA